MDRNPMRVPMQSAGVSGHREGRAVEGAGLHAKQRCSSTEFLRAGETASESVVSPQTGNCVLPTKTTGSTLSSQILRHYPTGNARVFVSQIDKETEAGSPQISYSFLFPGFLTMSGLAFEGERDLLDIFRLKAAGTPQLLGHDLINGSNGLRFGLRHKPVPFTCHSLPFIGVGVLAESLHRFFKGTVFLRHVFVEVSAKETAERRKRVGRDFVVALLRAGCHSRHSG